jgi:predicted transcriptional regulator
MCLEVLEQIYSGDNKPTRIMYGANLSWSILNSILDSLVEQELIRVEKDEANWRNNRTIKMYYLTDKGRVTLKYFMRSKNLINIEL